MPTLNLGVVAHVDAGKTTLTERLLHAAGVIDRIGRVDDGSTQTDTLDLERRRGITIRSAVVSFDIDGVTTNLIDTPGHSDFIAEVERALGVLDGVVLVVSAVEGVQAQSRVLMRVLQRLRVPTLFFVNKTDRTGAAPSRVLEEIRQLTPEAVVARHLPEHNVALGDPLLDVLTRFDDGLLARAVDDPEGPTSVQIDAALAEQTRRANVHPVLFGSAVTGEGIDALRTSLAALLPSYGGDAGASGSGTVFKIERGAAGEKIAYVRMYTGAISVRERLAMPSGADEKVTAIRVFDSGQAVPADSVGPGRIAKIWGLASVRVGDTIGSDSKHTAPGYFSPPSLETIVDPRDPRDGAVVHAGLAQLAEQDPLINLRRDDRRNETSVSLYGEVQKEVIASMLADDYGVEVRFRDTTTICVERPVAPGAAVEIIDTDSNPFLSTVGLRVDPAPPGSGVDFRLGVELGSMPRAFFTAVEQAVYETLREGLLGWEVIDCVVTMTHSGYWARQSHSHGTFDPRMSSTAGDFRQLTPLVLMDALRLGRTQVHEPIDRFDLELPRDALGGVLGALSSLEGVPLDTRAIGAAYLLSGDIPASHVHALGLLIPGLTAGEGALVTSFDHYRPVRGSPPRRRRTDDNPTDRREYLARLGRRESVVGTRE